MTRGYRLWEARLSKGFQMLDQEDDPTDFARWLRHGSTYVQPNPGGKILMEHPENAARAGDGGEPVTDPDGEEPTRKVGDRSIGESRRDTAKIAAMFTLKQLPDGHTNQARYCRNVREMGREFALIIAENTPHCADQTVAIRKVREAVLWAQEAVLREGLV